MGCLSGFYPFNILVVHRYMVDIFVTPELRLARIAPREYAALFARVSLREHEVLFAALKRTT
jgi:hypothetical protein